MLREPAPRQREHGSRGAPPAIDARFAVPIPAAPARRLTPSPRPPSPAVGSAGKGARDTGHVHGARAARVPLLASSEPPSRGRPAEPAGPARPPVESGERPGRRQLRGPGFFDDRRDLPFARQLHPPAHGERLGPLRERHHDRHRGPGGRQPAPGRERGPGPGDHAPPPAPSRSPGPPATTACRTRPGRSRSSGARSAGRGRSRSRTPPRRRARRASARPAATSCG